MSVSKSLSILKKLDDDSAIQLIDSAYEYYLDPQNYPLKKLTINIRAPFSAIYSVMKKAGVKVYQDISNMSLSKPVKQHLMGKISSIYEVNAQRISLLVNYKDECNESRVVDSGNISEMPAILQKKNVAHHKNNFLSCQWKINYVLVHSKLHRVMMPEIHLEIQLEGGQKVKMTLSNTQFDELRRQVATLLRSMHQLECVRYLNR